MIIYSPQPHPYVYRLDNPITGEFYIGYRKANKVPSSIDLPRYRTSSKIVKPRFDEFNWTILAEFFDADSALTFEQQLIRDNIHDLKCLNGNWTNKNEIKFKASTPYKRTDEVKKKISERAEQRLFDTIGLTPEQFMAEIKEMYFNYNYGIRLIAFMFKVRHQTVMKYLKLSGVSTKPSGGKLLPAKIFRREDLKLPETLC